MNFGNGQPVSNKIIISKTYFWMMTILLFAFVIKNSNSDEVSLKATHHQVEMSGFAFIPKQLSVNIGDTITWTNKDMVPHNIMDSNNQKTISPDLATGETFTFVVENTMFYECGPHPSMKGKILLINLP